MKNEVSCVPAVQLKMGDGLRVVPLGVGKCHNGCMPVDLPTGFDPFHWRLTTDIKEGILHVNQAHIGSRKDS